MGDSKTKMKAFFVGDFATDGGKNAKVMFETSEKRLTKLVNDPEVDVTPVGDSWKPRSICDVAKDIKAQWKKVYFGAVPYLDAMMLLTDADSSYGLDSAKEVVLYFLSNAASFRGPAAVQLKNELMYIVQDGTF
jgi:hypothetical protein